MNRICNFTGHFPEHQEKMITGLAMTGKGILALVVKF
jgi:hypothetical protein